MSLLAILEEAKRSTNAGWTGTWARMWFQPSVFSAQKFIIGVFAVKDGCLHDFRVIENTSKFACIYGKNFVIAFDHLVANTRLVLGEARSKKASLLEINLPPGLSYELVGLASGKTPTDALEEAISEGEVPMETSPTEKRQNNKVGKFTPKNLKEIYSSVMASVLAKAKQYDSVLMEAKFGDENYTDKVNLVLNNSAGMVANGWFGKPEEVVLEMYKAASTVESYMAMSGRKGKPAVFLLRPTTEDGLRKNQSEAIEAAIDVVEWKLEKKGMLVATHNHEDALADEIIFWAKEAA